MLGRCLAGLLALELAAAAVLVTPAATDPKVVAFDALPKDIRKLHVCASAASEVEVSIEKLTSSVLFLVTCPAARGALTATAVYVAQDARGHGAKRVTFEARAADGGAASLDTLFSAVPAREGYTRPDDPMQKMLTRNDRAWVIGAWGPQDRPGVCAISARWRIHGDKGDLWFWEEARECPNGALPKYEAKVDNKPPALVER